ncbi:MAG: hypothetical protein VX223_17340 [Myxococcota bacterium]|nr:hypothetical protein [Myxococcota bacterium]
MTKFARRHLCMGIALSLLIGCYEASERRATIHHQIGAAPLQSPTPKILNPEKPTTPKPITATPRIKREILVGGCLATCEDPTLAIRTFITSAMQRDKEQVRTYINTARLVYNNDPIGETWASQYLAGELGERRVSIDKWLKTWLLWVEDIIDPADRRFFGQSIRVIEQNQRRMRILYRPPDRRSSPRTSPGTEWLLVLEPRGLEWLITNINEHPEARKIRRP